MQTSHIISFFDWQLLYFDAEKFVVKIPIIVDGEAIDNEIDSEVRVEKFDLGRYNYLTALSE